MRDDGAFNVGLARVRDANFFTRKQCNHHKVNLLKIEFAFTFTLHPIQCTPGTVFSVIYAQRHHKCAIFGVSFGFWRFKHDERERETQRERHQKIPEKNTLIKVKIRWLEL